MRGDCPLGVAEGSRGAQIVAARAILRPKLRAAPASLAADESRARCAGWSRGGGGAGALAGLACVQGESGYGGKAEQRSDRG